MGFETDYLKRTGGTISKPITGGTSGGGMESTYKSLAPEKVTQITQKYPAITPTPTQTVVQPQQNFLQKAGSYLSNLSAQTKQFQAQALEQYKQMAPKDLIKKPEVTPEAKKLPSGNEFKFVKPEVSAPVSGGSAQIKPQAIVARPNPVFSDSMAALEKELKKSPNFNFQFVSDVISGMKKEYGRSKPEVGRVGTGDGFIGPLTKNEAKGAMVYNFIEDIVVGQNIGVNQEFEKGAAILKATPKYQYVESVVKSFADKQFTTLMQKFRPLKITFQDLSDVTRGTATNEQRIAFDQFNKLRANGMPVKEILTAGEKAKVKPRTKLYDFIADSIETIKRQLTSVLSPEEQKLLQSGIKKESQSVPVGTYTGQELRDKILTTPLQETAEGKALIKASIEADKVGQSVAITPPAEIKGIGVNIENQPQSGLTPEPTLYHGTKKPFTTFDSAKIGDVQPSDWGNGFYFTDSKEAAGSYTKVAGGNVVMEVKTPGVKFADESLIKNNPDFWNAMDNEMNDTALQDYLKAKGYDGLKVKNPAGHMEYVVFDPNKIKITNQNINAKSGLTPEVKNELNTLPKEEFIKKIHEPLKKFYQDNNTEALGQAQYEVMAEMDFAEAGARFKTPEGEWGGTPSTFPQWVPEELRSKKLFNKVMDGIMDLEDITYPDASKPRQRALYDAILDEIDRRAGIDGAPIRKLIAKQYDERKQAGLVPKVRKSVPETKPKEPVSGGAPGGEVTAQVKTVEVPQVPLGEGEKKISKLEARVQGVLQSASQETIDKLGLSTYNELSKKENIAKATEYVIKNPDDALKVLTGEIETPPGILRNAIYVAMQNKAVGDVNLARKIASITSTRLGQEISILTEIDPDSPVKVMKDVINIKEEAFRKKYGGQKVKEVTDKVVSDIKNNIKKPDKWDWGMFLDEISCPS